MTVNEGLRFAAGFFTLLSVSLAILLTNTGFYSQRSLQ